MLKGNGRYAHSYRLGFVCLRVCVETHSKIYTTFSNTDSVLLLYTMPWGHSIGYKLQGFKCKVSSV